MNALAFLGLMSLIFLSSIFNGYTLSVLWEWFVVPTFNAPILGIAPAIGIALVVSYMTHQTHDCEKKERDFSERIMRSIATAISRPLFGLFFGWIIHLFM